MKTVLITGCSSGFGRELVTQYLQSGWRVIASLRDSASRSGLFSDELSRYEGRLRIVELDVTNRDQREETAELIRNEYAGALDCLVNNAGYGLFGALEDLSEDQLRHQMEVNFFAPSLLTRELLPFLRAAGGRIINLSSVMGYSGAPLSSAYCASKYALEGLTESLYYELKPHGVQVALVEPGGHRTQFATKNKWGEGASSATSPYALQTANFERMQKRLRTRKNPTPPANVARAILKLSIQKSMPLRVRCGKDATAAYLLKRFLSESALTALFSRLYSKMFLKPLSRQETSA